MIFYDFMRKLSPKESHIQLQDRFGEKSPPLATEYNLYGEFNPGRKTLSDEMRSGRPADVLTQILPPEACKYVTICMLQVKEKWSIYILKPTSPHFNGTMTMQMYTR